MNNIIYAIKLGIILLCSVLTFNANATIVEVTSSNDNGSGTLRSAITNLSSGDTIKLKVQNIWLYSGEINIANKSVFIDGSVMGKVTISAQNSHRIFNVSCYFGDSVKFKNLIITKGYINDANAMGGAFYGYISNGKLVVENCDFTSNTAEGTYAQGGAVRIDGTAQFINCKFYKNKCIGTNTVGGAIACIDGDNEVFFTNCELCDNEAALGGAIYTAYGGNFVNNTITNNKAKDAAKGGGAFAEDGGNFVNCILYKNTANGVDNNFGIAGTGYSIKYSALESGSNFISAGTNNIGLTETPFRLGTKADSLYLKDGSVCIDAGTTTGIVLPKFDLAGYVRFSGSKVDLGAYEFSSDSVSFTISDTAGFLKDALIMVNNDSVYTDSLGRGKLGGKYVLKDNILTIKKAGYGEYIDTIYFTKDTAFAIVMEQLFLIDGPYTYDNSLPFANNRYNYSQTIYLNRELPNEQRTISSLSYYWGQYFTTSDSIYIYMAATDDTVLTDWIPINEFIKVYQGTMKNLGEQWSTTYLNLPFTLPDKKNLVIAFKQRQWNRGPGSSWEPFTCHSTGASKRSILFTDYYINPNPKNPPLGTLLNYRPTVYFNLDDLPTEPEIYLTKNNFSFIDIETFTSDSSYFKIYNRGAKNLVASSVSQVGSFSSTFPSANLTLLPGEFSEKIYVKGFSETVLVDSQIIKINSNASNSSSDTLFLKASYYQVNLSGKGTKTDPFQITTLDDLIYISKTPATWDNHFKLMGNIDCLFSDTLNGGLGFSPIGDNPVTGVRVKVAFTGTFDGNNKIIYNLYVNRVNEPNVGLFGFVGGKNAEVKDLGIENAYISGLEFGGILSGEFNYGNVTNVYTTGRVMCKDAYAGGLTGYIFNTNLSYSYSSASVQAWSNAGGLVGYVLGADSNITRCYASGSVYGYQLLGGLAGKVESGKIESSFYDSQTSLDKEKKYGTGLSTEQMMFAVNYGGWKFDSIWQLEVGKARPNLKFQNAVITMQSPLFTINDSIEFAVYLKNLNSGSAINKLGFVRFNLDDSTLVDTVFTNVQINSGNDISINLKSYNLEYGRAYGFYVYAIYANGETSLSNVFIFETPFCNVGKGTADNPYGISTLEQLKVLSETSTYMDKHFKLLNNINAAETKNWNSGNGFAPIGIIYNKYNWERASFKGSFNGNGYIISNLYINRPETYAVGFIGFAGGKAEIKNLGLENVFVNGRNGVGTILGSSSEWSNSSVDVKVNNCYATGNVICQSQLGGGIVGYAEDLVMKNCYSKVAVVSGSNPYSYYSCGGVAGSVDFSQLLNCYSTSYIDSVDEYIGTYGNKFGYNATAVGTYFDYNLTGIGNGNGDSLYTSQFFDSVNFKDYDFKNVWAIEQGKTRPYLQWQKVLVSNGVVNDSCSLSEAWIYNKSDNDIIEYGVVANSTKNKVDSLIKVHVIKDQPIQSNEYLKLENLLLNGLVNNTEYLGRAYAMDADSNVFYGDAARFIYKNPEIDIVSIDITDATACSTGNGQITVNANASTGTLKYKLNDGAWQASKTFSSLQINTYKILVSNGFDTDTAYAVVKSPDSPDLTNFLSDTTLNINQLLDLKIEANGTSLTYQWKKNNSPISGATSSQYNPQATSFAYEGEYFVEVRSGSCKIESNKAYVKIVAPVEKIKINLVSSLFATQKASATSEITPDSASNKEVFYKSSDRKVAKVGFLSGEVSAVGYGKAYIYAISKADNTIKDSSLITVFKIKGQIIDMPQNNNFMFKQNLGELSFINGYVYDTLNNEQINGTFEVIDKAYMPISVLDNIIAINFIPADTLAYDVITGNVTITIKRAIPVILEIPVAEEITYGLALSDVKLSGGSAEIPGVFKMANGASIPQVIDSGNEFEVIFMPNDSINYSYSSAMVHLQILKTKPILSVLPVPDTLIYGDSLGSLILQNAATNTSGEFNFMNQAYKPSVSESLNYYQIFFTPQDIQNYYTSNDSIKVIVSKANPVIYNMPQANNLVYGDNLSKVVLFGDSTEVAGKFNLLYPDSVPEVSNSGNYFNVEFVPNDKLNYNSINNIIQIFIDKFGSEITEIPIVKPFEYGKTLGQITIEGGDANIAGSFQFTYSDYLPNVSESGQFFPIKFIPADSLNNTVVSSNIVLTILKANPSLIEYPDSNTITYGKTLGNISLINASNNTPGTFSFLNPEYKPLVLESGNYFDISFIPNDTANYNIAFDSIKVFLSKAIPEIAEIPGSNPIVYGDTLKYADLIGGESPVSGYFNYLYPYYVPNADENGAPIDVIFVPHDNSNYDTAFIQIPVIIEKALLTATALADTFRVGDGVTDFKIKMSGFVNNDSIDVIDEMPEIGVENIENLPVGNHEGAILVFGGSDNNYNFTYVFGDLAVLEPSSIHTNNIQDITIYPNPASEYVIIEKQDFAGTLQIVNALGKVVFMKEFDSKSTVKINAIDSGTYLIILKNNNKQFFGALVIN